MEEQRRRRRGRLSGGDEEAWFFSSVFFSVCFKVDAFFLANSVFSLSPLSFESPLDWTRRTSTVVFFSPAAAIAS